MAAAPVYVHQRVVGVLSLASREPHTFDHSRMVWLLAMVLAPFVSALRYTSQALEMEGFIQVRWASWNGAPGTVAVSCAAALAHIMPPRLEHSCIRWHANLVCFLLCGLWPLACVLAPVQRIMPPLLEQNYLRNTAQKRPLTASSAGSGGGPTNGKAAGGGGGGARPPRNVRDRPNGAAAGAPTEVRATIRTATGVVEIVDTIGAVAAAAGLGAGKPLAPAGGSEQFARNAEVLITGAAGGCSTADLLAPPTPASSLGAKGPALADLGQPPAGPTSATAEERPAAAAAAARRSASGGGSRHASRAASRVNGRASRRDGMLTNNPALSVAISNSMACDVLSGGRSGGGSRGGASCRACLLAAAASCQCSPAQTSATSQRMPARGL